MDQNTSKEEFRVLSDREHVLMKSHIYVGSMAKETYTTYIEGKLKELTVVPALNCICREVLDNCIDEYIRSEVKRFSIDIEMTDKSLKIRDSGRGIPVELAKDENGHYDYRPTLCWTKLRSGTSFVNHEKGPSQNGVGSSLTNIFSLKFIGKTCDGKKECTVVCENNLSHSLTNINNKPASKKTYTEVYCEPDFKRFNVDKFSDDDIAIMKEQIYALSAVYNNITFSFNGQLIKSKNPKTYIEMFSKPNVSYFSEDYFFSVFPTETDNYCQLSFLDGLNIKNGGAQEEYISYKVSFTLQKLIKKKYKIEISSAEVKRGLFILFDCKCFPNLKFDSQVKNRCVNTSIEVSEFLGKDIDWEAFCKKILDNDEIIQPIIEFKLAKLQAEEKRQATLEQKKLMRKYVEKLIPAKSKDCTLFICEGLSAIGRIVQVRNPKIHAGLSIRGCLLNTYGLSHTEILKNQECSDIMASIGLTFDMSDNDIDNNLFVKNVGILTDQDLDGFHITELLINFLSNWKRLFETKRVFSVPSPLYILSKGNEPHIYFYTKEEYMANISKYKGYNVSYIKGLGSLDAIDYSYVLNHTEKWIPIEPFDKDDDKALKVMFSDDTTLRKQLLQGIKVV